MKTNTFVVAAAAVAGAFALEARTFEVAAWRGETVAARVPDFAELGKTDPMFAKLAELTDKTNGLWNKEAEDYLLKTLAKD